MDNISGNPNYSVLAKGTERKKEVIKDKEQNIIHKPLKIDLTGQIKTVKDYYDVTPSNPLGNALIALERANSLLKQI